MQSKQQQTKINPDDFIIYDINDVHYLINKKLKFEKKNNFNSFIFKLLNYYGEDGIILCDKYKDTFLSFKEDKYKLIYMYSSDFKDYIKYLNTFFDCKKIKSISACKNGCFKGDIDMDTFIDKILEYIIKNFYENEDKDIIKNNSKEYSKQYNEYYIKENPNYKSLFEKFNIENYRLDDDGIIYDLKLTLTIIIFILIKVICYNTYHTHNSNFYKIIKKINDKIKIFNIIIKFNNINDTNIRCLHKGIEIDYCHELNRGIFIDTSINSSDVNEYIIIYNNIVGSMDIDLKLPNNNEKLFYRYLDIEDDTQKEEQIKDIKEKLIEQPTQPIQPIQPQKKKKRTSGGNNYKEKYLEYKLKYLNLKNKNNI